MASPKFVHEAQAVAQINTETPANPETDDIFAVKLTDHLGRSSTVSFTVVATETVAAVCTALQALMATAKTNGEIPWTLVTATDDTTHITITADTAGDPFAVTATATEGGGNDTQTFTDANTTACNGPKLYSSAENWETGAVPVAADTPILPAGSYDIYGSDQSAVALNGFTREEGHTGDIGSNLKPLQLDLADSKVCDLDGAGEVYVALTGATATLNITGAGSGSGDGTYGMVIITGEAAMEVNISCEPNESVGLAPYAGQTGTFTPINVASGIVKIGSGVTVTAINASEGADVVNEANVTTYTVEEGAQASHDKTATVTNMYVRSGATMIDTSTGTHGHVYIADAIVDRSGTRQAVIWTDTDVYGEYQLLDPHKTITFTNPVTCNECGHGGIDRGTHYNVAFTAAG